jgi:hypothetical protein
MTDHLSWETLNDLVDDVLSPGTATTAESHARECATCGKALAELRSALSDAGALPSDLQPPDDLWTDVRATIEAGKVAHLPLGSAQSSSRGFWVTRGSLGAAAVILVAATASLTSVAMRSNEPVIMTNAAATTTVLASWQSSELAFQASVVELRAQMEVLHDHLSPETLVKVERALATIDLAIAEGREALLRDPSNAALSELVASNYRQKIELLRRMTQLASS